MNQTSVGGRRMVPRILITHTLLWPNAARLALAFRIAGCSVQALCRGTHPLQKLSSIERIYTYNPFAPLRSLRAAIEEADPDLVIPCDDRAVVDLHRLHNDSAGSEPSSRRIRALIERSLGRPDAYDLVAARSKLPAIAIPARVLWPRTGVVATVTQLRHWLRREGFPAVLKADFTSGGNGVVIVHNMKEAEAGFQQLSGLRDLARAVGRLGLKFDPYMLQQRLRGVKPKLSVQTLIRGKLANCAVACWQGEVVAGIAVEVVVAQNPTGNATVVRVVTGQEMLETARRIVGHLGMSGFCGFDFMLDDMTGRAYLLEINPRATQIGHLALGKDRDLPAALRARVAGEAIHDRPAVTDREVIALFPQEWQRNPRSRFLVTNYHDVPYDEPDLLKAYLGTTYRMQNVLAL